MYTGKMQAQTLEFVFNIRKLIDGHSLRFVHLADQLAHKRRGNNDVLTLAFVAMIDHEGGVETPQRNA